MGIGTGFFRKRFAKLNISKSSNNMRIEVSLESLGKKIDEAQDALDAQVWSDIKRYMPLDTGNHYPVDKDILHLWLFCLVYLFPG